MGDSKFTAVIQARTDRRVLATIMRYYGENAGIWIPRNRSEMVRQALEDFAALVVRNGTDEVLDIEEADMVLHEFFGQNVSFNSGGKGARNYTDELRMNDRRNEIRGCRNPIVEENDAVNEKIRNHMLEKAKEAGYSTIDEFVDAGGKPKQQMDTPETKPCSSDEPKLVDMDNFVPPDAQRLKDYDAKEKAEREALLRQRREEQEDNDEVNP